MEFPMTTATIRIAKNVERPSSGPNLSFRPTPGRLEIRHRYSRRLMRSLKIKSLSRQNLAGVSLHEACLAGFDLRYTDLHGASLRGTDLRDANLSGANLSGADLSSASLEGARLCGALYDAATIWPAGIDPASFGAVRIKPARPRMLPDEDTEPNALRGRFVATMWGRWVVRLN
jgi:hypothetical protein